MIHENEDNHFINTYIPIHSIGDHDYLLCYHGSKIVVKQTGDELALPQKKDVAGPIDESTATFLFAANSVNCFLIPQINGDRAELIEKEIFDLRTSARWEISWLGALGHHLYTWYQTNRFCGKCGTPTLHHQNERALCCPTCGNTIYPKISPAIIVAITSGNKILLARAQSFRSHFYSLIAGYVETGESLEQTLIREVKEEVGIEVKNIRYYKSQPWPFSGSLMTGFWAEADDSQPIKIDPKEIVDAGWFPRGNLPVHPNTVSIAGEMIALFEQNQHHLRTS